MAVPAGAPGSGEPCIPPEPRARAATSPARRAGPVLPGSSARGTPPPHGAGAAGPFWRAQGLRLDRRCGRDQPVFRNLDSDHFPYSLNKTPHEYVNEEYRFRRISYKTLSIKTSDTLA